MEKSIKRQIDMLDLISKQTDYIQLLESELEKFAPFLSVHGMGYLKSDPIVLEGKRLRGEISKLKDEVYGRI